jgi:hypothetical protein
MSRSGLAEHIFGKNLAEIARPSDIAAHVRSRAFRPVYASAM